MKLKAFNNIFKGLSVDKNSFKPDTTAFTIRGLLCHFIKPNHKALRQPGHLFLFCFLQEPLPNLSEILLWKYFQNYMYSFRKNWKMNLRICHIVPRLNLYLFTISLKSKERFQWRFEITWSSVYGSVTWFQFVLWGIVNRTGFSMKDFSLIGSFLFYICWNLSVAQTILPRQQMF